GLVVAGQLDRVDRPHSYPGDLDLLARDHERGVVEHSSHQVTALAVPGRPVDRERRAGSDRNEYAQRDQCASDPHGEPPIVCDGLQCGFESCPESTNGAERSGGATIAAPGQRWRKPVFSAPDPRRFGAVGVRTPPLPSSAKLNAPSTGTVRA